MSVQNKPNLFDMLKSKAEKSISMPNNVSDQIDEDIDIEEDDQKGINISPVVNVLTTSSDSDKKNSDNDNIDNIINGPEDDPIRQTVEAYKNFDKIAWSKKAGLKLPHFPFIQKKLEGLDEGLYLFAAESNAG